jgi:putative Ca2+/H+ antiporter (TMEM165/GDT1 family)
VRLYPVMVSFAVVFLGELPDKTMFASLILATRGRPGRVWVGAAAAFAVHVAIAVTAGIALVALVPHLVLELVVAAMFLAGAIYAWLERPEGDGPRPLRQADGRSAIATAFVVIFLAEWGDLTQILTANLAARSHAPLEVAVGATAALWAVAALAVSAGQTLQRHLNVALIHRVTAVVLLCLAGYTLWTAFG